MMEFRDAPTNAAAPAAVPNDMGPLMNHMAVSNEQTAAAQSLASMSVYTTDDEDDADSPDELDRLEPVSPMDLDTRVAYAELVIAPPLEPALVLALHQWLMETAEGTVEKVIPSMTGDTVVIVQLAEAIPLWRLMRELPFVADMSSDPYAGSAEEMTQRNRSRRRFRLTLKAA